jgi:general secretion pathway protein B
MSLILEALKKSEAERQRQSGPTLLEVRIANPQRRYPIWAVVVGLLLAVNMILLLVFMLRRPSAPNQDTAAASPPLATTAPMQPAVLAAPAMPLNTHAAPAQPSPSAADNAPTLSDGADATGEAQNPADEQPAIPKTSGSVKIQRDDSAGYSSLPSFSEVNANMPDLRLDLHVYAEQARDRYALINMQTVHEGDTLSEGARVLAITREGVALDYRGQQFMLRPQ